jgi:hypothetical protein
LDLQDVGIGKDHTIPHEFEYINLILVLFHQGDKFHYDGAVCMDRMKNAVKSKYTLIMMIEKSKEC